MSSLTMGVAPSARHTLKEGEPYNPEFVVLQHTPPPNPVPDSIVADFNSQSVPPPPWRPSYLSQTVLASFLIIFTAFIASLISLQAISDNYSGLTTSSDSLHYLWTYGPTALIVSLAAFWSRVECQAKLVAPWHNMFKGPTEARRSLLLDYLSAVQLHSIYKALCNKDYYVAAATAVSTIIRILTVVSTALITLSPAQVYQPEVPCEYFPGLLVMAASLIEA
jgi:hypothetical protein